MVHVWTQKGLDFMNDIKANIRFKSYPIERSRGVERKNTLAVSAQRAQLFEDVNRLNANAFFARYAP